MSAVKSVKRPNEVVVRKGRRDEVVVRDRALRRAIGEAYTLWRETKEREPRLERMRELIAGKAREFVDDAGTVALEAGEITCRVTFRQELVVPPENVPELRRLLGRSFSSLIRSRTRFSAAPAIAGRNGESPAPKTALRLINSRELNPQFRWGLKGKTN